MPLPLPDDPAVRQRIEAYRALVKVSARQFIEDLEAGGVREKAAIWMARSALVEAKGVVSHAAEAMGISRSALITRWLNPNPELAEFARSLRDASNEHQARTAAALEARGLTKQARKVRRKKTR